VVRHNEKGAVLNMGDFGALRFKAKAFSAF